MVLKISYVCTHESCSPFNHHHDRNEDRVTFAWSCPVVIAALGPKASALARPNFPTSQPPLLPSFALLQTKMSQPPDITFTRALPKVELHAHLTGSISRECLHQTWQQKKTKDPAFEMDNPLTAIPTAADGSIDVVR